LPDAGAWGERNHAIARFVGERPENPTFFTRERYLKERFSWVVGSSDGGGWVERNPAIARFVGKRPENPTFFTRERYLKGHLAGS